MESPQGLVWDLKLEQQDPNTISNSADPQLHSDEVASDH